MICPKWLVQASAVGILGAAVAAAPMTMTSDADDEPTTIVRQTAITQAEDIGTSTADEAVQRLEITVETTRDRGEQRARHVRIHTLRQHLTMEDDPGRCRIAVDMRQRIRFDEARNSIEETVEQARQAAEDSNHGR